MAIREIMTSEGNFKKSLIGTTVHVPGSAFECNVKTGNIPDQFTIKKQTWTLGSDWTGTVDYEVNIKGERYLHVVTDFRVFWVAATDILGGVIRSLYLLIRQAFSHLESEVVA
ncbi:hypothetical protein [Lactobacillus hominis]|uniref:Uncharacterized protein n=1 Tax=Lactobacillus hominis DSM 23910 = CRBIP 24.179 TaxID=1423758 RepID=I7JUS1_9LACO|nr:hypothetical protein [Lactobacillus hominis]KRM84114.1 hypothetical protein FC41_GL001481 [Lactobacillus hominis DSM 23910 = CRBIP 24.179]MCT3348969.1 hypothetical protein [Lactobacillus hominis]CCI81646.1 Protein of unknown function [Lactobacillus hominis DSM 23910 = CRBIP 24.179]